jgi:NAD(P)-dependent dehydrogenase (short-subunit alcohol dehydrogenase family)
MTVMTKPALFGNVIGDFQRPGGERWVIEGRLISVACRHCGRGPASCSTTGSRAATSGRRSATWPGPPARPARWSTGRWTRTSVTDPAAIADVGARIRDELGDPDILVNNAAA